MPAYTLSYFTNAGFLCKISHQAPSDADCLSDAVKAKPQPNISRVEVTEGDRVVGQHSFEEVARRGVYTKAQRELRK